MGYIRHHAIVVTSFSTVMIQKAKKAAEEIFDKQVSNIVTSPSNGHLSFFVAPDGSSEGWPESANGDNKRKIFVEWLKSHAYDDGSNALDYAELFYGDDDGYSEIVSHN